MAKLEPGTKSIAVVFPTEVSKQLARMAIDQDRPMYDVVAEAFNLLFERHGLPPIAPLIGGALPADLKALLLDVASGQRLSEAANQKLQELIRIGLVDEQVVRLREKGSAKKQTGASVEQVLSERGKTIFKGV